MKACGYEGQCAAGLMARDDQRAVVCITEVETGGVYPLYVEDYVLEAQTKE